MGSNLFQENEHYDEKLKESLVRSRTNIFELAMCNEWEYFATFTIDKTKYDRYNLANYYKDFAKFINNMNTCKKCNIKYLLIPETHKDGAWHLHGLFMGIPERQLVPFRLEDKIPKYIRKQLKRGFKVFKWINYQIQFGFCDLEKIRNIEACCKYITKYITKDLSKSVKEINAPVYYCSKGLKRAEIIHQGECPLDIVLADFENAYIWRKDFFDLASALDMDKVKFFDSFINSGLDDDIINRILNA